MTHAGVDHTSADGWYAVYQYPIADGGDLTSGTRTRIANYGAGPSSEGGTPFADWYGGPYGFTVCTQVGAPPVAPSNPDVPTLPGDAIGPTAPTCATQQDVCTELDLIRREIQYVERSLAAVSFIQSGQFVAEGDDTHDVLADAILLEVSGIPPGVGQAGTNPVYYFGRHYDIGIGWVTLGSPLGWCRSVDIHFAQQWIAPVAADVSRIGWHLPTGVTVTVTTFVAETPV